MTRKRRMLVVLCAVVLPALVWHFGFRSHSVAIGAATWFVQSPGSGVLAVGRPDGQLGFIDLDGKTVQDVVPGTANDAVVFATDAVGLVIQGGAADSRDPTNTTRYVARVPMQGTSVTMTKVEVGPDRELVPVVEGARRRGRLERDATELLLAVLHESRVERVLWIDVATLAVRPVALPAIADTIVAISAAPQHAGFALVCVAPVDAKDKGAARIRLFDAAGSPTFVIEDVAPVQPYWLPDLGSLLFERAVGGISRFHPPDGKPVWVCDGRLPHEAARSYIGAREMQDPFVLIEKKDGEGFVQVARVWPFESGGRRTANITTGLVHKFGLAVSSDHRFIAFRQVDGALGAGPVDERLVFVNQSESYRSTTIAHRSMPPAAVDVGPLFTATDTAILYVADETLWKVAVE